MAWLKRLARSRNWYVVWRDASGRQVMRSTRTAHRPTAERICAEVAQQLALGRFGIEAEGRGPTLAEAAQAFLEWSDDRHRPSTRRLYGWILRSFAEWAGDVTLTAADAGLMARYWHERSRAHRKQDGLRVSPNGVALQARHLRAFFGWCGERGWIAENPVRDMPRALREGAHVQFLGLDEMAALLQAERDDEAREFWLFLVLSGMRSGEAVRLRWEDVDLRVIRLSGDITKGGRRRVVEISASLGRLLDEMRARRDPVRLTPQAGLWRWRKADRARRLFKRTAALAELDTRLSLHALRHTAASWWVMSGVSLKLVAEMLGHSSVVVTERHYAHLQAGRLAEEMERSPLAKLIVLPHRAEEECGEGEAGDGGK